MELDSLNFPRKYVPQFWCIETKSRLSYLLLCVVLCVSVLQERRGELRESQSTVSHTSLLPCWMPFMALHYHHYGSDRIIAALTLALSALWAIRLQHLFLNFSHTFARSSSTQVSLSSPVLIFCLCASTRISLSLFLSLPLPLSDVNGLWCWERNSWYPCNLNVPQPFPPFPFVLGRSVPSVSPWTARWERPVKGPAVPSSQPRLPPPPVNAVHCAFPPLLQFKDTFVTLTTISSHIESKHKGATMMRPLLPALCVVWLRLLPLALALEEDAPLDLVSRKTVPYHSECPHLLPVPVLSVSPVM